MALNCDMMWLSSWVRQTDCANPILSPRLGFTSLPYPDPQNPLWAGLPVSEYKSSVARELLSKPGPPVIWIDDEVDLIYQPQFDIYNRVSTVCPDSTVGISKSDLDYIRSLLTKLDKTNSEPSI